MFSGGIEKQHRAVMGQYTYCTLVDHVLDIKYDFYLGKLEIGD